MIVHNLFKEILRIIVPGQDQVQKMLLMYMNVAIVVIV